MLSELTGRRDEASFEAYPSLEWPARAEDPPTPLFTQSSFDIGNQNPGMMDSKIDNIAKHDQIA